MGQQPCHALYLCEPWDELKVVTCPSGLMATSKVVGGPFSFGQPSPFSPMGTVGWVGVLTRCMRVYYDTTTSPNIGQPLRNDPQMLRAGCLAGFNGGCIAASMPRQKATDVVTAVSACAQTLRSQRPLQLLSETASERQQLPASCRILQRASSHCSDWLQTELI